MPKCPRSAGSPSKLACLGICKDAANEMAGKGWGWGGELLWALALLLRAREEEKTRKLTVCSVGFFFFPNRPQQFTGTQRHTERCLPFITGGRRLKAWQGGKGGDPRSTVGVIAMGLLQEKDLENIN